MEPAAIIAALCLGSVPALVSWTAFTRWRGRRRNADDRCAGCGGPQYVPRTGEGPSLVEGRLVCARCAATTRRRLAVALGGAGALTAVGLGAGLALAWTGEAGWLVPLLAGGQYALLSGGVTVLMKRANRQALGDGGATPALGAGPPR
jgi:hypothetical protein